MRIPDDLPDDELVLSQVKKLHSTTVGNGIVWYTPHPVSGGKTDSKWFIVHNITEKFIILRGAVPQKYIKSKIDRSEKIEKSPEVRD